MKQDVGFFNVGGPSPDLKIENGDLKADNGLETACLISLYSDRRVTKEELPGAETDQRGWFADRIAEPIEDKIGSILWLYDRGKITEEAAVKIESGVRDSLQWLLDDGIAKALEVSSSVVESERVVTVVSIYKPDGDSIPFKFIWDGQALKLSEG